MCVTIDGVFMGEWISWPLKQVVTTNNYNTIADFHILQTYLNTGQHKHRINAHTDTSALNGIRTYDPSGQASEYSSCAATVIGLMSSLET
jgi:hypothetical protein